MRVFIHCRNCGWREDAKCSNCSSRDTDSGRIMYLEEEIKRLKEGLLTSGNVVLEKTNQDLVQEIKIIRSSLNLKEMEKDDLQAEIRALETKLNEKENSSPYQVKISKLESKLTLVKRKLTE